MPAKSKTPVRRPTRRELAFLFDGEDTAHHAVVLMMMLDQEWNVPPTSPAYDAPLPTFDVVMQALLDWMTVHGAMDPPSRQMALHAHRTTLREFAKTFDCDEPDGFHMPASFTLLDLRYAAVRVGMTGVSPQMYDVLENRIVERLAEHALTSLSCDLNVLLLRLFDKLERVRKLQERKDAADQRAVGIDPDDTKPGPGRD